MYGSAPRPGFRVWRQTKYWRGPRRSPADGNLRNIYVGARRERARALSDVGGVQIVHTTVSGVELTSLDTISMHSPHRLSTRRQWLTIFAVCTAALLLGPSSSDSANGPPTPAEQLAQLAVRPVLTENASQSNGF
jgi:hypothetical protein